MVTPNNCITCYDVVNQCIGRNSCHSNNCFTMRLVRLLNSVIPNDQRQMQMLNSVPPLLYNDSHMSPCCCIKVYMNNVYVLIQYSYQFNAHVYLNVMLLYLPSEVSKQVLYILLQLGFIRQYDIYAITFEICTGLKN